MQYHYEALNEQTFQKFAQALILVEHPRTQCMPVGQPDGGRDAIFFQPEPDKSGFVVFQVKYSRAPKSKAERKVIGDLIRSEKEKVEQLIHRGATHYYLVTNVQGTAHLDVGSIDKAHADLTNAFGIPSQVWWRDDLDRRLDNALDVKWSYPEVLRATDLLPLLIKRIGETNDTKSARALKSYMASQYDSDREIKFKQVDLKRTLTDLFVDLPLGEKIQQDERDRSRQVPRLGMPGDLEAYLTQLNIDYEYDLDEVHPFDHSGLAGAFLLQMPLAVGVSRFVLEGAPGQGKSTVTQFLCQVNRLRLLRKGAELDSVEDAHKYGPVRAPFRVDLRDYAAWVTGRHPFAKKGELSAPEEGRRSLESFLAMQVTWHSGSLEINQDQLLQFFARSHSVIVLDGFDEVADISTRTRVVAEICKAAARLDAHARSLQIIVTSRPAAFANSPGFPENDWVHLELKNLHRGNIEAYKNKWIEAQRLNQQERDMVSSTLEDKLEQPHLRDLARNPMQLAILLHLIHVQGAALPEKRTTLYEEYMKLFFNREAEKSTVVRDHRELLLSIHGVLAWVLQTQAEEGSGSGSINKDALRVKIKNFLEAEEHDPSLADTLLTGTSERVGALVSRVQGTYEFEVQPLREYFAARHLYKTSPYSPPGGARTGTRPARFDALARSAYWTNVTRFFCGFYDVGELGTLVDDLLHLGGQAGYRLISQPRRLAMMLLSDHVFAQSPRAMKRLINFVTHEPGFRRLTAQETPRGSGGMELPETAGRSILFDVCASRLDEEADPARRSVLRGLMAGNADSDVLKSIWKRRRRDGVMACDPLREALDFGIVERFDLAEIEEFTGGDMELRLRWLAWAGHHTEIAGVRSVYEAARAAFFDGVMTFPTRRHSHGERVVYLEVLTELLNVHVLAGLFATPGERVAARARLERGLGFGGRDLLEREAHDRESADSDPLASFTMFLLDHLKTDMADWRTKLVPWSTLVDRGFEIAPGSVVFAQIAAVSTATEFDKERGIWESDGFAATKGLVDRMYVARQNAGIAAWWREQLDDLAGDGAVVGLAVLLSWGKPDVLVELKPMIEPMIDGLDARRWSRLWSSLTCIGRVATSRRPELTEAWFDAIGFLSPRFALTAVGRVDDESVRRRLSRRVFSDYGGTDQRIIRQALGYEFVRSEPDEVDWEFVSKFSKLAKGSGVETFFGMHRVHAWNVPEDTAEAVLSDFENHCAQFITICERVYSMGVARRAAKVAVMSEKDHWFAPHPA